jgi:heme/copper-type cytochrome/quinol oxidase subunit 3
MTSSTSTATPGRRTVPNGLWGMLLFVTTEAVLLTTLVGTYLYLRFRSTQWPPPGVEPPAAVLPLVLTGVLVLTTAPMAAAAQAARLRRRGLAAALIALAMAIQGGYLAWQIVLFFSDLDKFSPDATAYGSAYFTMLGAHHAHVAIGLLFDLWLLARLTRGLTTYRIVSVQAVAIYWAFVNAVAILVVAAQVSPS